MKVILLCDVKGQGKKEDILTVSDGYARNYLLPRKWAVEAKPAAIKEIQRKRAAEEQLEKERRAQAQEQAKALAGRAIRVTAKCGETGRLYGSVTNQEIADELKKQYGFEVDKRKIDCEPIRQTGEYDVSVGVYPGVFAKMKVLVTGGSDK
ncbi:MAG: 50S ribosomal protein L9 [Clostridiales bacterium]|nr:50S ribosomal protein L9 [Clostridiales bacterium]